MKKKIVFLLSWTLMSMQLCAQVNPKPGFVITNNGDTIRGVIDFRTNERLAKQCDFWAAGETKGETYKPGDIEGFRFDNGGKYFVTRRLNVTGTPELYFAEFMVQGMMNLYCVAYNQDEYFFFEREDGEMAQLTKRAFFTSASIHEQGSRVEEQREQYGKVKLLLKDSWKAAEEIKGDDVSRKQLVNAVRDYHKDVCTDGSSCMVYEYNEKSDGPKNHFKAIAGYSYYTHERTAYQTLEDENYSGSTFEAGLGFETELERVTKGGALELCVVYSPQASFKHHTMVRGGHESSYTIYKKARCMGSIGLLKRYGKGKIVPLIRVGGFYVLHLGNKEERYYMSKKIVDKDWEQTNHFGAYIGGGVEMALGKHAARLHADLFKSLESSGKGNMMKFGVTAEYVL